MSQRPRASRPTRQAVRASLMPFFRQSSLMPISTLLTHVGPFSPLPLMSGWSGAEVTSASAPACDWPAPAASVASLNLDSGMSLSNRPDIDGGCYRRNGSIVCMTLLLSKCNNL